MYKMCDIVKNTGTHTRSNKDRKRKGKKGRKKQDMPDLVEWYKKAAECGHAKSAYALGEILEGIQPHRAEKYYKIGAEKGFAWAKTKYVQALMENRLKDDEIQ